MRERGLKCDTACRKLEAMYRRSREGAWIEICAYVARYVTKKRRSREGAWIEIYERGLSNDVYFVAPVRERGLK